MAEWLIVDASVIVKAFIAEDGSENANRIWYSERMLAAPAHALGEVGEVIRRKLKAGEVTEEQWHAISHALPGSILPIALDEIFLSAMDIALELSQSFYDCLYLAAAFRWSCPFVTADERLMKAAAGSRWGPTILSLDRVEAPAARI